MRDELKLHLDLRRYRRARLGRLRLSRPFLVLYNAAARVSGAFFAPPRDVAVDNIRIPSRGGALRALVFRPAERTEPLPVLLYFHGGGFISPDFGYLRHIMCAYARQAGCAVVYVRYRLAPKDPFPAAFFDACDSYLYLPELAAGLGLDADCVAVGGDSAGGCLAAALSLWVRDERLPPPLFQLLLYPVLDSTLSTESIHTLTDVPGCNPHLLRQMWGYYLGSGTGSLPVRYASPSAARHLFGLPPAYIETEQYDSLRDEGRLYAERLAAAGVPVLHIENEGAFHAFDLARRSGIARQAIARRADALRAAFHPGR